MAEHYQPGSKSQDATPTEGFDEALNRSRQTQLDPLSDTLFKAWAEANGVPDPDKHPLDLKGIYQETGGKVMPPGTLQKLADQSTLQQELMKRVKGVHEIQDTLGHSPKL